MEPVTACACPPTLTWTGKNVIPPFSLAIPKVSFKGKKKHRENVDNTRFSGQRVPIFPLPTPFPLSHLSPIIIPAKSQVINARERTQYSTLPSLPCTGMVTVCPLLAVTVAVAMVTKVCPGTGVTDTASPGTFCTGTALTRGCGGMRPGVPPSVGLSFSTNSRLLVELAVGELYLSYSVVGDDMPRVRKKKRSNH